MGMDMQMDMDMPMMRFAPLFGMWAVMMAAMMVPTMVPTLRSYEDLMKSANGTRWMDWRPFGIFSHLGDFCSSYHSGTIDVTTGGLD